MIRRLTRPAIGAGLAVLVLAGCGTTTPVARTSPTFTASAGASPRAGCADLVVLGLRGQTQSRTAAAGVGAEVLDTVQAIRRRLPAGTSLRLVAVLHPARSTPTQAAYDADVATGVRMVERRLDMLTTRCPDSRFALVGFSEGAQVVHLAVASAPRPVAFVVLLGDPLRRPVDDSAGVRLLDLAGALTGRGSNGPGPGFPEGVRSRVVEVCAAGDNVCNVPDTGRVGGISDTHRHFYERPATSRAVAQQVATVLRAAAVS